MSITPKVDVELDNRDLVTTELRTEIILEVDPFYLFMNALENSDEELPQQIIQILDMWLNYDDPKGMERTIHAEANILEVYKCLKRAHEEG